VIETKRSREAIDYSAYLGSKVSDTFRMVKNPKAKAN
jgi:hypothetical protein